MSSRSIFRYSSVIGIFIAVGAVVTIAAGKFSSGLKFLRAKPRPDIFLISIDTLAAKHLELYGYDRETAPFLTSWAKQAVVFKNSYSSSSYTMPSHMSIFTGLSVIHHKVCNYFGEAPNLPLDKSITTIAEMMKNAGYETAWFGPPKDPQLNLKRGFDYLSEQGVDELITGERLAWLRQRNGKPKFAFFHTYVVHDPYTPRPPYYGKFHDIRKDNPSLSRTEFEETAQRKFGPEVNEEVRSFFFSQFNLKKPEDLKRTTALYDEGVSFADSLFQDLIESLKDYGLHDDAVIIFTSDHGEAFMEHGKMMHTSLHHEILHVPLIVRGPGFRPTAVERPVQGIDLMPTLIDLLGTSVSQKIDGESFLADLEGRETKSDRQMLFADINAEGSFSVQDATWKLIDFDPGKIELYRRDGDLFEANELSAQNPEIVARYRRAIHRRLYDSH